MESEQESGLDALSTDRLLSFLAHLPNAVSPEGSNSDAANSVAQVPGQVAQLSAAALAYIGDAVYELFIRTRYLIPPKRLQAYHSQVVAQVRAESQAKYLQSLQPYLTSAEQDILRRGRNAASKGPRRLNPEIYRQATSLETLLGYLYITDTQRLTQLLNQLQPELPAAHGFDPQADASRTK